MTMIFLIVAVGCQSHYLAKRVSVQRNPAISMLIEMGLQGQTKEGILSLRSVLRGSLSV